MTPSVPHVHAGQRLNVSSMTTIHNNADPRKLGAFGLRMFLLATTMLFAAGVVGYLVIRLTGTAAPPRGTVQMPAMLWASTAVLVVTSTAIELARQAVRRERQASFRRWLTTTTAAAVLFVVLQGVGMQQLLAAHDAAMTRGAAIFGLVFCLVLLHALHVLGGIAALGWISYRAAAGRYDHEFHAPVSMTATYWHFIDGVWLVMFGMLVVTA